MEMAWIKIFVLTLSECVAPAGKTVCQENQIELEFLTRANCEAALEQLVTLKNASPNVIVNDAESGCRPSGREQETFASLAEVSGSVADQSEWQAPKSTPADTMELRKRYEERLASMQSCDETNGVAPCRMGEIIIEGATGEPVEVWRSGD